MSKLQATVFQVILSSLLIGCATKKPMSPVPPAQTPTVVASNWSKTSTPFRAVNITAVGGVFWVCGGQ